MEDKELKKAVDDVQLLDKLGLYNTVMKLCDIMETVARETRESIEAQKKNGEG